MCANQRRHRCWSSYRRGRQVFHCYYVRHKQHHPVKLLGVYLMANDDATFQYHRTPPHCSLWYDLLLDLVGWWWHGLTKWEEHSGLARGLWDFLWSGWRLWVLFRCCCCEVWGSSSTFTSSNYLASIIIIIVYTWGQINTFKPRSAICHWLAS